MSNFCCLLSGCRGRIRIGASHVHIEAARSSFKASRPEVNILITIHGFCRTIIAKTAIGSLRDVFPCLGRAAHVLRRFDLSQAALQLVVGEDVEAAVDLLLDAHVTDLLLAHVVLPLLFSKHLIANVLVDHVANTIARLLVLLALVFFLQALFVVDLHVDRVVHHSIARANQ